MKFLVDAQLPKALCSWLEERQHEAIHVTASREANLSDVMIDRWAVRNDLTIISKDQDFVALRGGYGFRLVWLRCGNASKQALWEWLDPRWPQVEAQLAAGNPMIELS